MASLLVSFALFAVSICSLTLAQQLHGIVASQDQEQHAMCMLNTTWATRALESDISSRLDLSKISGKVAKENGWSPEFTKRATAEYEKFLFIIKHHGSPAVPSKVVDKVWHQHILDTIAYTKDMKRIFNTFIHHVPSYTTDERRATSNKFKVFQDRYTSSFGEMPRDIWFQKTATDCYETCKGGECNKDCKSPDDECSCVREEGADNENCTDMECTDMECTDLECVCMVKNGDCIAQECSGGECSVLCGPGECACGHDQVVGNNDCRECSDQCWSDGDCNCRWIPPL